MTRKQVYLKSHVWAAIKSEGLALSPYIAFLVDEHRDRIAKAREFVRRATADPLLADSLLRLVGGFAARWAAPTAPHVLRHRFREEMADGDTREQLNTAFSAGRVERALEELTSTEMAFDHFCLVSRQHTILEDDAMDWCESL